jgi:hypothetical protein
MLEALKRRAAANRRSLQQELLWLLEITAAEEPDREEAIRAADTIRERLARSGRVFSDSTELIREDRSR